jgi:hypothetical protein
MLLGKPMTASVPTSITNGANANPVFVASSRSSGNGVEGESVNGHGVRGVSASRNGVQGRSDTDNGVYGYSNYGAGVYAYSAKRNGVWGYTASNAGHAGIVGQAADVDAYGGFATNLASGTKVYLAGAWAGVLSEAPSSPDAVAVAARAGIGATALEVQGRAKFDRSGRASVAAGRSFVDVQIPGGLTGSSLVVATPMLNRAGVYVQSAVPNPSTGNVRINLNKVPSSNSPTPIAWFVIN